MKQVMNTSLVLNMEIETPKEILNHIKKLDYFPNSCIAYMILLRIPVTIVTIKSSFSKLELLKTYLRLTMLQKRLHGLAILSIKSELLKHLKHKNIISDFVMKKVRKK